MTSFATLVVLAALSLASSAAAGARECQVRVLRPIVDDLGNAWKAGQVLPVDIERDDPSGGAFCAHGGSCLPRRIHGHEALQLIGCTIGPVIDSQDRRLTPR